jgi:hypothetical protein
LRQDTSEKIAFLERFKADIRSHFDGDSSDALRTRISRAMPRAKNILSEAGALKTVTLSPPPAIGGLVVRNGDPFSFILQDYYGMSMIPAVADMIEEGIGVLESPEYEKELVLSESRAQKAEKSVAPDSSHPAVKRWPKRDEAKGQPELPEKVTISWLVQHVPVSFWIWLFGLLAAAFVLGMKLGPLLTR